ncbi:unnamed protein product [Allacma fusca]|uniref:Uncharacterized protein n=1 Tax=Allacma fusca TaxID=39272 RepID=A0A8J2PNR1_9HEXA|nr:unnamed protein product [Allacma fusca]
MALVANMVFAYWSVIGFPVFEAILLLKMAQVYEDSVNLIAQWKRVLPFKDRIFSGLVPTPFKVGGTVKKTSPLIFIMLTSKLANSLMLTSSKQH